MNEARQLWHTVATEPWIVVGTAVRDADGEWWIAALPASDDTYGYAQIEVSDKPGGAPCRHIWLTDFLRDFEPVT